MAKLVENVYGDALFEVAKEQGREDEIRQECEAVSKLLASEEELVRLIGHPKIPREDKLEVLENVFKGRISGEVLGLLMMLAEKGHFDKVQGVLGYVVAQIKEACHIGKATVSSAVELSESQKKMVEDKLLATTIYESVEVDYSVDPSLIGGMVIQVGGRVVDSSVRTQISKLAGELSKIQLKVGESAS